MQRLMVPERFRKEYSTQSLEDIKSAGARSLEMLAKLRKQAQERAKNVGNFVQELGGVHVHRGS